jgi:N-acetylglutamate synthase-like GNAT family acetyltransferase
VEDWSIANYTGEEPPDLTALLGPSLDEQHGLVRRTLNEWADGTNRFNKPGEVFYVASVEGEIVGMCGLNIDPFVDDRRIGRIRHLYVHPGYRRRQIGRSLVDACLRCAAESFIRVRLRTFQPVAVSFYESIGFDQIDEPEATHSLKL